jgi:hypothetical protein
VGLVILAVIQTILNLQLGQIKPKPEEHKLAIHRLEAQMQIAAMLIKVGVEPQAAMDRAAKIVADHLRPEDLLKEVEQEISKEEVKQQKAKKAAKRT